MRVPAAADTGFEVPHVAFRIGGPEAPVLLFPGIRTVDEQTRRNVLDEGADLPGGRFMHTNTVVGGEAEDVTGTERTRFVCALVVSTGNGKLDAAEFTGVTQRDRPHVVLAPRGRETEPSEGRRVIAN